MKRKHKSRHTADKFTKQTEFSGNKATVKVWYDVRKLENRNRKLKMSTAPAKVKSWEISLFTGAYPKQIR